MQEYDYSWLFVASFYQMGMLMLDGTLNKICLSGVDAIADRKLEAMNIYADTENLIATTPSPLTRVTKELWVDVLIEHEHMTGHVDPCRIAESILPWYLMRAVTCLEDNKTADEATDEVQQQFTLAVRQWNYEASHH